LAQINNRHRERPCASLTGVYSYPVEEAAKIAVGAVWEYIQNNPEAFDFVSFSLFDDRTLQAYKDAYDQIKVTQIVNSSKLDDINFLLRNGMI